MLFVAGILALGLVGATLNVAAESLLHLAPMYVVVFLAGAMGGPLFGFLTGAAAAAIYLVLAGSTGIYMLAPVLGMAEAGGLAGFLARLRFVRWRTPAVLAAAAAAGFLFTILFSITADVTEWLLAVTALVPVAHTPHLGGVVLSGLAFNLETGLVNMGVFAGTAGLVLAALRRSDRGSWVGSTLARLETRIEALGW